MSPATGSARAVRAVHTMRSAAQPRAHVVARSASGVGKTGTATAPTAAAPMPKGSRPPLVRLRKLYKRLLELRGLLPRPIVALFKAGLYFKALLILAFLARLASHSAQSFPPSGALSPSAHLAAANARLPPPMRIIVVVADASPAQLTTLLGSLAASAAPPGSALDVVVAATSVASRLPWPLMPLWPVAFVLFGPARFDHAAARAAAAARWPHGPKTLVAARKSPDWTTLAPPGNGTLVFVDAGRARAVAPAAFRWLAAARARMRSGMQANVAVFALDAVSLPSAPPIAEAAILTEAFLPGTAVFSPTADAWATFREWRSSRAAWAGPRVPPQAGVNPARGIVERMGGPPLQAWFAAFALAFEERVCHPVLPGGSALVLRAPEAAGISGTLSLASPADAAGLYREPADALTVPEQPSVVKWNGAIETCDTPFGLPGGPSHSRRVSAADVIGADAGHRYAERVREIAAFSRARGGDFVALALVSPAAVPAAMSWVCGTTGAGFFPAAVVLVAADDTVARRLRFFLQGFPRLSKATRVVSLADAPVGDADPDLRGSAAYWELLLRRTLLIRDLLNSGVALVHFSPHQAWLRDPLPAVRAAAASGELATYGRLAGYGPAEMAVTRTRDGAVGGGFMYMRPSARTRHLWSEIAYRFYGSFRRAQRRAGRRDGAIGRWLRGVQRDDALLTRLVLGRDRRFRRRFPGVRYASLSQELFVDAKWLDEDAPAVGRETPTVVAFDDPDDNGPREARARRAGLWYLAPDGGCKAMEVKWTAGFHPPEAAGVYS